MDYISLSKDKVSNFKTIPTSETTVQQKTSMLKELKLYMLHFKSLPPSNTQPIEEEFSLAIAIIELEMEFALQLKSEKNFELAYLKAKQFYFDFKLQTPKKLYFIGLYLLHLLANNRNTDFSTEVELISIKDLNDPNIRISINLEQSIMEGNYKALAQMKQSSDQFYNFYLGKFDQAIRYQIARSAEKAYDSLKIVDAMSLLGINNEMEMSEFVNAQNEDGREGKEIQWVVQGERIVFVPINKEKESIPAYNIMADTLKLGIEVEKIV